MPELGSAGLPGGPGSGGRSRPPRPAPKPRPRPPSHSIFGGIGRAISHVGAEVQHATRVASRPAPSHPSRNTSEAASGGGYGSAQANAYKGSAAYRQAIVDVFRHQAKAQQSAIVKGALKAPSYEGKVVLDYLRSDPQTYRAKLAQLGNPGAKASIDIGGALGSAAKFLNNPGGGKVPLFSESAGGPTGAVSKVAANFGKDLVNLPAEAVSTVGTLGGDVLSGKPGKALSDLAAPYEQLAQHPGAAFINHPLLSTLMVTGAVHGATRLAAAPVRALAPESALGRAVATKREGVALTGKLTRERPPYSKSPTIKSQQTSLERSHYTRAPTGELVPRSKFLRDHQLNQEIGQLVGVRERIRTTNRAMARDQRVKAITPSVPKRAAHGIKTALAYGPQKASIPGADVLSLIADGTIRREDTIAADLQKHLAQVAATRPELLDDPKALKAHDQYVKTLRKALSDKAFLRNPAPAFKAAAAYAEHYAPVEAAASKLGHFGTMSKDALQRRSLMHYAVTHMGAKLDPELGLLDAAGAKLPNQAILEHLKGPNGTRGRVPVYTPDRVRFEGSNAPYYVSSDRRPLPATKTNTLYAYTHGLTHPGHDALTEQHVLMQGVVDSHRAQNAYLETLTTEKPGGGHWSTYEAAKRDAPPGYKPINISQPFHPQESLDQALEGLNPASVEEEATRRSLDLSPRLQPGTKGRWAIIDQHALRVLKQHENAISPNPLLRTIRGLNNQFRSVALSTSAKHIPGVVQENLIRDIAHGVGFRSWVTGRRILAKQAQLDPGRAADFRTHQTGGQVAGMTEAGKTYTVSEHWAGTSAYPFLKGFEAAAKAPGLRQLRTAWQAWTKFAIKGTKKALEQQHQIAGLGKTALREHGYADAARTAGFMGLVQRTFALHGKMLEDAARGAFDPAKARQIRAAIDQMYGKWTDLSPSAQTALMFSPFGLWWVNSARFLARMPVDQPVKTSLLASATAGTQQERQAQGLDIFAPGALPLFEQGGIPVGGKIIAQNYYSPFGVANNPLETASSLIQPWAAPIVSGTLGVNWLGKPLSSPSNPHGDKRSNEAQKAQYILDSILSSFVPLYTKAKQVAEGGASAYDVSPNWPVPATKTPGRGAGVGLAKSLQPFRSYKKAGGGGGGKVSVPGFSSGSGNVAVPGFSSGGRGGGDVAIPGF